MLARMQGRGTTYLLLVGVKTCTAMKEIFKEVLKILSNWGNEKFKPL